MSFYIGSPVKIAGHRRPSMVKFHSAFEGVTNYSLWDFISVRCVLVPLKDTKNKTRLYIYIYAPYLSISDYLVLWGYVA